MAPFNLSDLAVKEMKIPGSELAPPAQKSYLGRFLLAHFLDFWAIFLVKSMCTGFIMITMKSHMISEVLERSWSEINYSALTLMTWATIAFTYYFCSYYLNNGQSPGMKFTGCRISIKGHDFRSSLRWATFSLLLNLTAGLIFKKGMEFLEGEGKISAHDHLWHELVAQKEMAAPDVRTLKPEIQDEDLWKTAA